MTIQKIEHITGNDLQICNPLKNHGIFFLESVFKVTAVHFMVNNILKKVIKYICVQTILNHLTLQIAF